MAKLSTLKKREETGGLSTIYFDCLTCKARTTSAFRPTERPDQAFVVPVCEQCGTIEWVFSGPVTGVVGSVSKSFTLVAATNPVAMQRTELWTHLVRLLDSIGERNAAGGVKPGTCRLCGNKPHVTKCDCPCHAVREFVNTVRIKAAEFEDLR